MASLFFKRDLSASYARGYPVMAHARLPVIRLCIDSGKPVYNWYRVVYNAGRFRRMDIIEFFDKLLSQDRTEVLYVQNAFLCGACRGGHYDLICQASKTDKFDDECIGELGAHYDLMYRLIQEGRISLVGYDIRYAIGNVAKHGDMRTIDLCATLAPLWTEWYIGWSHVLYTACEYGYYDMAVEMLKRGADDVNEALIVAARYGHDDLVSLMIQHGADDFETAFSAACSSGHQQIALRFSGFDQSTGLYALIISEKPNLDLARAIIRRGCDLESVFRSLFDDVVRLRDVVLCSQLATEFNMPLNWDRALRRFMSSECLEDPAEVIDYLIQHGARDVPGAIRLAVESGFDNLVGILQRYVV